MTKPADPPATALAKTLRKTMTPEQREAKRLDVAKAGSLRLYKQICLNAEPARFSVAKAVELAGLPRERALDFLQDEDFLRMWNKQYLLLTDGLLETQVRAALGYEMEVDDGEGGTRKVPVPPDLATARHLSNALDPKFKKTSTVEHRGNIDLTVGRALEAMTDEDKIAELRRLGFEPAQAPALTLEAQFCPAEPDGVTVGEE